MGKSWETTVIWMGWSKTYPKIGTSRNRGTPKAMLDCYWVPDFKKRLAFFWEYLKTGVDSINLLVSPIWLILWNTIELSFACVVIWSHLVFPHHVFHNCRICVQNFRRFFPWKITVQSFFPYVLWFFHDFSMIFPLKSAPLVHTAPFWKKTAPASSLVATWTAFLMGFHQRNLRKR